MSPYLLAPLPPVISIHLALAVAALLLGPLALWARKGSRLHRALGYAWVTVMLGAALSALFIRDHGLPNLWGYTPIHLFVLVTFIGIGSGLWAVAHGRIANHQRAMRGTYIGGCVVAGLFALAPGRWLGHRLWHDWLGWL